MDPAADKRAARNAQTVSELCDLYLADAVTGRLMTRRRAAKKPSTLITDRGRILRHIKPLLGSCKVAAVTCTAGLALGAMTIAVRASCKVSGDRASGCSDSPLSTARET